LTHGANPLSIEENAKRKRVDVGQLLKERLGVALIAASKLALHLYAGRPGTELTTRYLVLLAQIREAGFPRAGEYSGRAMFFWLGLAGIVIL
jgi:hypothetical protein